MPSAAFYHHGLVRLAIMLGTFSANLNAKTADSGLKDFDIASLNDSFYFLFIFIGIALLPFLAVVTTSFTKIVVVLSIARQAMGTAQTPPNMVIMSLAMMLTCFSMYPVFVEIYDNTDQKVWREHQSGQALFALAERAKEPLRSYLAKHARDEDRQLFFDLMKKSESKNVVNVSTNDFIILAPAFLISELTLAFQIGFLLYLPFLVIDMTVANLLMALGMQMLSPTTISLPFKILLFVLVDGWRLLAEGLAKV